MSNVCVASRHDVALTEQPTCVSTIFVRALIEAVEAWGTPVPEFLRQAGVSETQLTAYGWVEMRELDRLIACAVERTGDPAFGLHWTERSPMMKFDVLAMATAYAPTLRAALSCVLRFQSLLFQRPEVAVIEEKERVLLRLTPLATTELASRVRAEVAVSGMVRLLRHVGAPEASLRRIHFAHRPPPYADEYARALGPKVHFDQAGCGIEFDRASLDHRVHHANLELHQLLTSQAQEVLMRVQPRARHAERLREHLRRVFPRLPEMRETARALALSERSLRRRLAEEGWSYSAILLESRQRLAQQLLLQSVRSTKQIGHDVGFASHAAFLRAFKRWTGESPASYRAARRASAGRARLAREASDAADAALPTFRAPSGDT